MFCLDPGCNKPICRTCFKKEHKRHDVTEIEDKEKEILMKELVKIKMNLESKVEIFSTVKKDITEKTNILIDDLQKRKEEIILLIDRMIKEAEG